VTLRSSRFWLGEEDVLESRHLGRVAYVDHHDREPRREVGGLTERYAWFLRVYVGTIVGFTESRGKVVLHVGEEPDDISTYPDYAVTIYFEDGRKITVAEKDRCSIWFPSLDTEVDA